MASVCVNNNIGISPVDYSPVKCPSYGWLSSRISLGGDDGEGSRSAASTKSSSAKKNQTVLDNAVGVEKENSDLDVSGDDFEFRLEDPVTMLPAADELFFDGKLVPLHLNTTHQSAAPPLRSSGDRSETNIRRINEISSTDHHLFSPKPPGCSIRWKELLRLKKLYRTSNNAKQDDDHKTRNASRSIKQLFLQSRGTKAAINASVESSPSLSSLKESDNESKFPSSRRSLSSSYSSGHEFDDLLPRLSLDSNKPNAIHRNTRQIASNLSKVRVVKHKAAAASETPTGSTRFGRSPMRRTTKSTVPVHGVSMDSPRMNSSGKIVFESLERSSSSPSTFNGAPVYKHRAMERSYSANVRITPVLNVPVCSLRGSSKSGVFGFPLFSSQQKKDSSSSNGANRNLQHQYKNRTDRI